jgi:hypothetical protein
MPAAEGNLSGGVLGGLPIRIGGAALHIVDLLAVELERDQKFDQRLHVALPRQDTSGWSRNGAQVAGADGREADAAWASYIDDATCGEVAFECA